MKRILTVMLAVVLLLAFALSTVAGELEVKLIEAASGGHADVVRALLDKGADVNAKNSDDYTALIAAAYGGHANVVRALLDKKADVNAKNSDGQTALMVAARLGYADVIRILKSVGAKE